MFSCPALCGRSPEAPFASVGSGATRVVGEMAPKRAASRSRSRSRPTPTEASLNIRAARLLLRTLILREASVAVANEEGSVEVVAYRDRGFSQYQGFARRASLDIRLLRLRVGEDHDRIVSLERQITHARMAITQLVEICEDLVQRRYQELSQPRYQAQEERYQELVQRVNGIAEHSSSRR